MSDLQNPIFHDDDEARAFMEAERWPNGAVCPHCGEAENVRKMEGKSHRAGLYQCGRSSCRKQFTVTVGTVFERSKIGLSKWLMASYLLSSSKKGISTHQLHRMLGVTYKSAWFMTHRIREAMRDFAPGPVGGGNKVVEVDETYVGGKAKNRAFTPPPKKEAVVALVERGGKVRSQHVPKVTSRIVGKIVSQQIEQASYIMTDESPIYPRVAREFGGHGTVNHSIKEYVRGGFWHTNTVENYFSIFKRGINGVYQAVSEKHLKRYLGEFDFRYNTRDVSDMERARAALKGAEGKRLTYRRTGLGA
ncbi:IS1595 family transposase [Thalassobaculum sp.]|uniref:IS1595 family transposase n=1 Tax=Thalassobaculum sp. TaxID=2022740 RepID=UPI0032EE6822